MLTIGAPGGENGGNPRKIAAFPELPKRVRTFTLARVLPVTARRPVKEMEPLFAEIEALMSAEVFGRVVSVQGLLLEVAGPIHEMSVGALLAVESGEGGSPVPAEVVGFRDGRALCMPFAGLEGVRMGCRAVLAARECLAYPGDGWLGRVVNAMGEPWFARVRPQECIRQGFCATRARVVPPPLPTSSTAMSPIFFLLTLVRGPPSQASLVYGRFRMLS